ncbi:hypothetical protein SAMN05216219_1436 [Mycetocola miduiensis]|uniref:Uncharacterized protein n=1 Tax=Mycetocola miduiensis TaxID=995034 RepID=A0A1I5AG36_9MICO|nr:hypothetical protein SAMN05216219_1436 [Mycetocola miduiensis]
MTGARTDSAVSREEIFAPILYLAVKCTVMAT